MGTFITTFRISEIPEDKKQQLLDMERELLWRGGMMGISGVSMYGKTLPLLHPAELKEYRSYDLKDESYFPVWYNYFENDSWETWCVNKNDGRPYGGKVGFEQFCKIAYASALLEEIMSTKTCLARVDLNPGWAVEAGEWISHLFCKNVTLRYRTIWNAYASLFYYADQEDKWDEEFEQHEEQSRIDIINALPKGIDADEREMQAALFLEDCYKLKFDADAVLDKYKGAKDTADIVAVIEKVKQYKEQLENDGHSDAVSRILDFYKGSSYIISKNESAKFKKLLKKVLPQIAVIALALVFKTPFWPIWWDCEGSLDNNLFTEAALPYVCDRGSLNEYIGAKDEDCIAFYSEAHPYEFNFINLIDWFEIIRKKYFKYLNSERRLFPDQPATKTVMTVFCKVLKNYSSAAPFEETFYEFVENFKDRKYQAMLKTLVWLSEQHDNKREYNTDDKEFKEIRRYYALLYNKSIRDKIFGSDEDFAAFVEFQKQNVINMDAVEGPSGDYVEEVKQQCKEACEQTGAPYDMYVNVFVEQCKIGFREGFLTGRARTISSILELVGCSYDEAADSIQGDNPPELKAAVKNFYNKIYT